MKLIVAIFIAILCHCKVNGQSYKAAFKSDICNCLEEESLKRHLTENAYKTCFREILPKYATQIDAEIVEEDINQKFYKGQLARKELIISLNYELIYSCDTYYNYLDRERTSKKLIARENAKESELERYNQMVALSPNAMAYYMRAQLQFYLGNIKEAEVDVNKSLEVNPYKDNVKSTRHELLLLAWIYEEQERYSEAIVLYDKIYLGDLDTEVARLRALADKKSGGTEPNMPIINKNTKSSERRIPEEKKRSRSSSRQIKGKAKTKEVKAKTKKKDTSSLRKLLKIGN